MDNYDLELQNKQRLRAMSMAKEFFNGDLQKVDLWMRTNNPLFGNHSPLEMISIGRGPTLIAFIEAALEENRRNE